MILMIDNYDSFTWNIVQYFWELGAAVEVYRNDELSIADIEAKSPAGICISPGPCSPTEAGISMSVIQHFAGQLPLFGICLGQQSIGAVFGGACRAGQKGHAWQNQPDSPSRRWRVYGFTEPVYGDALPQPCVDPTTLPDCLEVTAWTEDEQGEQEAIMGLRHRQYDIEGVQFHPESILSEHGHAMLDRFLARCA